MASLTVRATSASRPAAIRRSPAKAVQSLDGKSDISAHALLGRFLSWGESGADIIRVMLAARVAGRTTVCSDPRDDGSDLRFPPKPVSAGADASSHRRGLLGPRTRPARGVGALV